MTERIRKTAPRFSSAARQRLAQALAENGLARPAGEIERHPGHPGPWPLTAGQERLRLAELLLGPTPLYHVPFAAHLVGALDVRVLEQALQELVRRHDVLQARFVREGEASRQERVAELTVALDPIDLASVPRTERWSRALELANQEFRRPFDLAHEPPFRVALWRLDESEHVLLLTLHHIVSDGATIRILCAEMEELYAARAERRASRLGEPE